MEKSQGRGIAKWVLVSVLFICLLVQAVEGSVTHQVGGTPGWSLPSRSNVNYTVWASTQTFSVGDTLYFNYSSAYHNVLNVTEAKYETCDATSPIMTWDDGATRITLNETGTTYYICGIPTHCTQGQKVAVTVEATSLANSTSAGPSPSNSTSATAALSSLSASALLSPLFALYLISILL